MVQQILDSLGVHSLPDFSFSVVFTAATAPSFLQQFQAPSDSSCTHSYKKSALFPIQNQRAGNISPKLNISNSLPWFLEIILNV
jgi:hypothetical protein